MEAEAILYEEGNSEEVKQWLKARSSLAIEPFVSRSGDVCVLDHIKENDIKIPKGSWVLQEKETGRFRVVKEKENALTT